MTPNSGHSEEDFDLDKAEVIGLMEEDESDEDDVVIDGDVEVAEEPVTFEAGAFPEGQMNATRLYLSEIGFSPLLSAEEEVYFSRLALKGDMKARQRMIESNLRLVVKISRRYLNRGLALLDLTWANDNGVNVIPRTGATATEGGLESAVPDSVIIDGSAMNEIVQVDPYNMQATVQCGVTRRSWRTSAASSA